MDSALFLIPILTGIIFTIAGFVMLKYPPKTINSLYGYRTSSSMSNQETWDFAQLYSAKQMIKLGVLLAFCSLIGLYYHPGEGISLLMGLILLMSIVYVLISSVECAIKRKFY